MDAHYKNEEACASLHHLIGLCTARAPKLQLRTFGTEHGIQNSSVTTVSKPESFKITSPGEDGEPTEVVLRLQGVLSGMRLPPIMTPINKSPQTWTQQVYITGLGSPLFQQYLDKIREVEFLFARQLPEDSLESWQPQDIEGHQSIRLWNRYFTSKRDQGSQPELTFSDAVDPQGILARATGKGLVHLEENQVKYFQASYPKPGKIKYSPTRPVIFRRGDIVEIQMTFNVVPTKNNSSTNTNPRYKLLLTLNSVSVLDTRFATMAAVARKNHLDTSPPPPRTTIKRKIGYDDSSDDDDESMNEVKRMKSA